MAELRLEELTAKTIVAARNLALKPGQAAFIAPETYEHSEQDLDPAGSWPRVVMNGDDLVQLQQLREMFGIAGIGFHPIATRTLQLRRSRDQTGDPGSFQLSG